MQERHTNEERYFNELATTSREYYIDYVKQFMEIKSDIKIAEIGCGHGGNLLPFAELGCKVTGVDICEARVIKAKEIFDSKNIESTFIGSSFFDLEISEFEKFDLILVHDIIEHITDKSEFISKIRRLLAKDGIVFWRFPAWQMPFGGHQQICKSKLCSHMPFIHLLPKSLYKALLKSQGEKQNCIDELLDIKNCATSIELFEKLIAENGYTKLDRMLWFINPHYKQKFNLTPRKLSPVISKIAYIRNFFATSCYYITK
ncbi:MAG: class I SAM-dependent methyltransferase [Rikenellaceae bacterium]